MDGDASARTTAAARLRASLPIWGRRALQSTLEALRWARAALRALWQAAWPILRTVVQLALALLILLEEWGWRPLSELLGRLARWRPWARLEYAIARLPPYAALVAFSLPTALLLPLKFAALFLVARGQLLLAALLFAGAKVGATALVARLYLLTEPALLQIEWFAWVHDRFVPWKDALAEYVRSSYIWRVARVWKERIRRMARAQWRLWRPTLVEMRGAARAAAARLGAEARRLVEQLRARWAALQR